MDERERLVSRRREGQDGNISCPLDGHRNLSLVLCAVSRNPPGNDFPTFRYEKVKDPRILVIDIQLLIGTKAADFPP